MTGEVPEKQMESELYSTIRKRVNKYFKDVRFHTCCPDLFQAVP